MNYVFKDVEKSLALAIFSHNHPELQINLVRKKTEGVNQEMLIDKKANLKIAGLANIVNHLLGNSLFSKEADYVNWLCNHFEVEIY